MPGDHDVVVLGAGVAGLTAAMYSANHGLKTVVIETMIPGAQIMNAETIENLPGTPSDTSGADLVAQLVEQATSTGAELVTAQATSLAPQGPYHVITTDQGEYRSKAVILAMGSSLRRLGVPGEEELRGRGVSECATCDGPLYNAMTVAVVGGGDSAADEALTLTGYASKVLLIHRGAALRAQAYLRERLRASAKVQVLLNTVVDRVIGADTVTAVHVRDQSPKRERELEVSGVFVFIGLEPNSGLLSGVTETDNAGHVPVGLWMETTVPGLYAAGDIRAHSARQLASAAGDGATAAVAAYRYIRGRPWS